MKRNSSKQEEGPIKSRIMAFIASMVFAVPTTALIWFATNKNLAYWGSPNAYVDSKGFWVILSIFSVIAILFPKFFPAVMGKVWHGLIRFENWFG